MRKKKNGKGSFCGILGIAKGSKKISSKKRKASMAWPKLKT